MTVVYAMNVCCTYVYGDLIDWPRVLGREFSCNISVWIVPGTQAGVS